MLRWLFGRPNTPQQSPSFRELQQRVEELEDKYSSLERRFVRMQGEFSAYERWRAEELDDEEEEYEPA